MVLQQLGRSFADDDDIQDHGLLSTLVGKKVFLDHAFDVAACLLGGFKHVIKVINKAALTHTGMASAST